MSENKSVNNGAFRKKRVYFSQVSNVALRDLSLSLKAKGLYSLVQSYITLEDFTLYKTTLKKQCIEGEKAFESTWKELKDAGYLIQYRLQDEKGCYHYEYELLDEPNKELAEQIHARQNRKSQSEKNHNPKKEDMDKKDENQPNIHTPKKDVMDDGYDGQVGVYNKTDSINTDLNNIDNKKQLQQEEVVVVDSDVYSTYIDSFGSKPSKTTKVELNRLGGIIGVDTVCYAIEEAGNKAKGWDYARGMLNNWVNQGLKDLYDVVMNSENRSRVM